MRIALALPLVLLATPAFAHGGHVHWEDAATQWTWDFSITLPLLFSAAFYAFGIFRLWRRSAPGRGIRTWRVAAFASGWLLLAFALVSPLHWLGERLFSLHMVEHEILMILAAPLLVLSRPGIAFLWALPIAARRALGALGKGVAGLIGLITRPSTATIIHAAALWGWHAPPLYDAALANDMVHNLQHLSFFLTALLFWWSLLEGRVYASGAAIFYLFVTALPTGFLGIVITMARTPLYPAQVIAALQWGLDPLADQQLAGLIMWVPGGMIYAIAAVIVAALWIARSGKAAEQSHAGRSL